MATHKSAEKRYRQSLKRRARNRYATGTIRTLIKSAVELSQAGKKDEAKEKARAATRLLDKAAVQGIMHKKTVQRTISRLHARLSAAA